MGMAASQARYLALVARKSNCEYEGQQINQARLILSNQTANLFNQMLGLKVPVPPSTQDFTKIQYSYSDGNNSSTIDSWKQLSGDPEYNYIVQSHYNTDIYTGSVKKMVDPQVQSSDTSGSTSLGNWDQIEAAFNAMNAAQAVRDSSYATWQNTKMAQEKIIENLRKAAKANNSFQTFQSGLNKQEPVFPEIGYYRYTFENNDTGYGYSVKRFDPAVLNADPAATVSGRQTVMNNAVNDANTSNTAAQAAAAFTDAYPEVINTADSAIAAIQEALAIANLSGDNTAITNINNCLNVANGKLSDVQTVNPLYNDMVAAVNAAIAAKNSAAGTTDPDEAKAYAIEAANQAIIAADKAIEIATFINDNTALTNAQTAKANAQAAQAAAQAAVTLADAQTAANDANTAAGDAKTAVDTPALNFIKSASGDAYTQATTAQTEANGVSAAAQANFDSLIPEAEQILNAIRDQVDVGVLSLADLNNAILNYNSSHGISDTVYISDINDLVDYSNIPPLSDIQAEVLRTYSLSEEVNNGVPTGNTDIVLTQDVETLNANLPNVAGAVSYTFAGYPLEYDPTDTDATTNAEYLNQIAQAQALIDADYNTYDAAETIYQNAKTAYDALNRPTYIGNSELTLLGTLTDDQETELLQVVKDLKAQDVNSHIFDCFDESGAYLGGVYMFKLNGNTYYTTFEDLDDAYASNHRSNNYIDAQYKMPYYNASYVNTRIDQESKALLETDEEGRFSTVRFENDSVVYSLKLETITDDEAYQDAMNQYYYENAIYDKTVQDINAKTSLIHQEDQQLELRLKQLDTEQNALKTEMEAVQKIVKDNVDDTFKTFNG